MTSKRTSFLRWSMGHLKQCATVLGWFFFAGLYQSIKTRQFHWKAFWKTSIVACVAHILTAVLAANLSATSAPVLPVAAICVATIAATTGFTLSRHTHGLALWEHYLLSLCVAAIWGLFLTSPVFLNDTNLLGEWTSFADMSRGYQLLGPAWERLFVAAIPGYFFLCIASSSCTFLLYGDNSTPDTSFLLSWVVAKRHLSGHQHGLLSLTASVAMIGISLGVACLIAVTSAMSGYQQDVQDKILSTNAHILVQKYGVDFTEHATLQKNLLKKVPGVLAGAPFVFNEALLSSEDQAVGVLLKGIDPTTAQPVTDISHQLCNPRYLPNTCRLETPSNALSHVLSTHNNENPVLIGYTLYKRLGIPLGATVALTTPVGMTDTQGLAPKRLFFTVTGVFQSGMHEFDARLIYTHIHSAQTLLGMKDSVTGLEFKVAQPQHIEKYAPALLKAAGGYPYRTVDWRELNAGIFTALKLQKIVMFLVLTCIVIVASFNIASTLFMAVIEKSQDIAILKSMGATDASVMRIFVWQGWITGITGTMLGTVLGLAAAYVLSKVHIAIASDVYMVDHLEIHVQPLEVLYTAVLTLLIAHLSTLYPALKAAKQSPAVAFKNAD